MAYRIDYGPPTPHQYREKFPLRLIGLTCGFFALFLLGVKLFWPAGCETLGRFLHPVNTAGSADAVQTFLAQLRAGESFYDSLTAFCHQIIDYADLSLS